MSEPACLGIGWARQPTGASPLYGSSPVIDRCFLFVAHKTMTVAARVPPGPGPPTAAGARGYCRAPACLALGGGTDLQKKFSMIRGSAPVMRAAHISIPRGYHCHFHEDDIRRYHGITQTPPCTATVGSAWGSHGFLLYCNELCGSLPSFWGTKALELLRRYHGHRASQPQ
ncbi:hypothetical protein NDU88_005085 [Pleurodeles waltl]|uniref:Uncharacterized protein n=1 Tax=Pleurodeles waltl TaxID=8319 RepID=A0AAV7L3D4_PLEWA|nr:hypothetical protein NDU88_005085 [Pleurodeles waltl]